ncbi:PTS fructose transporter subunit IIABC [Hutsoniella sourekii]
MKLTDLFVKDAMDLTLATTSKSETLRHLAERFAQSGGVDDVDSYVGKLEAREAQSTTGVGDEIAIPHAQDASVKQAAIVFGRSGDGIEWDSFDGQPAKLIFMIAAPEGGGEHLAALAQLSKVLLKPEAKAGLLEATNAEEVLAVLAQYEEDEEAKEEETVEELVIEENEPYILAVTACPTGIAHTYMAEEKLNQAAAEAGYKIKVETNGQTGVGNRLTASDIEQATAIIVAADKQVEMARFDGKPVIITKVADGINKADELVARAAQADASIYHASSEDVKQAEAESEGESLGRTIYKHLMNGVSHMLPFVVAGGILTAISFFWGIYAADPADPSYNQIAQVFATLGNLSTSMMLPVLAGFIGHSMADRPGLVIGMMGGVFANPAILSAFGGGTGIFEGAVSSGFLGALVAGFLSGGIVWFLRKAFSWLPKSLEGMKPIFLFPVFGVLIMGLLMLFVVNAPMGAVMNGIINLLQSIPSELNILLGFVAGAMMSIDMGGPINKAAYVTGTALVTASNGAGSNVMAAVMVGGMVPPLAIALSATFNKKLWTKDQYNSALVNYVMGAAFITEGAIPFAASNPLKVIPSLAIGAGVAGALSMFFGSVSYVPHGGVFAVLAGGVTNPLMFLLAWIIGGLVGAVLLNVLLKDQNKAN